jgi:hypothetical protein
MKKIPVTKIINRQLLTEQLFAAFPNWIQDTPFGRQTVASVSDTEINVPDDADEAAVQAIIDAHDPSGLSLNQKYATDVQAAKTEFDGLPDWLKNATYAGIEQTILDKTVGTTTKQQALDAVNAAASLADVKQILVKLVNAVYGLVEVNQKIARILLAIIFHVKRRV